MYYQGIVEGLEDLGRDLIAKRGKEVEVIQCKLISEQGHSRETYLPAVWYDTQVLG